MLASEQCTITNASQHVDTKPLTRVTFDTMIQSSDGREVTSSSKATIKPGIPKYSQVSANLKESYDRHGDGNDLVKPYQNGSVLDCVNTEIEMPPDNRLLSESQGPNHNKLDCQEQPTITYLKNSHAPDDKVYDEDDDDSLSVDSFRYYSNRW